MSADVITPDCEPELVEALKANADRLVEGGGGGSVEVGGVEGEAPPGWSSPTTHSPNWELWSA